MTPRTFRAPLMVHSGTEMGPAGALRGCPTQRYSHRFKCQVKK